MSVSLALWSSDCYLFLHHSQFADNGEVISEQYKLFPVDLRDLKKLDDVITSANMDPRYQPGLIIFFSLE